MPRNPSIPLAAAVVLALAGPRAAPAQIPPGAELEYQREVFDYQAAGRPDPFRSLLGTSDLGIRFEDLSLRGVIYNPNARQSVAVLVQNGSDRRIRLRVGESLGGVTLVAVYPRKVDVQIEDFGVVRRATLPLKTRPKTEMEPQAEGEPQKGTES